MNQQFIDGVLYIYNDGEETPWLAQPSYPNGEAWPDETAALAWGLTQIDFALGIEDAPKPPDGPT
jgi:hypothetical protein